MMDRVIRLCRFHEDCDKADQEAMEKNEEPPLHPTIPSLKSQKYFTLHEAAQHAMQTGVMLTESTQGGQEKTQNLRAGINSLFCDHAALVRILIAKGIITEEEYAQAISETMQEEQHRYEDRLGVKLG